MKMVNRHITGAKCLECGEVILRGFSHKVGGEVCLKTQLAAANQKLVRLHDYGIDTKNFGDGDTNELWGRVDEFRGDADASLCPDDVRALAEWWAELHNSLSDVDGKLCAEILAHEKAERKVVWAGDLGLDRIEKGEILAERDVLQTQLEAWHKAFGTTQLTHAVAERDRLVQRVLEQGDTP